MSMEEFDSALEVIRHRVYKDFANKHSELLITSNAFFVTINNFQSQNLHFHAQIWNIALFLNIAQHDLSLLIYQVANEQQSWTRRLAARHLALVTYETTDDLTHLLGKPLRDPLENLGLLKNFDNQLREARLPLISFKKKNEAKLDYIRNLSAAHRDHDALILFKSIKEIDVLDILTIGIELGNIQIEIGKELEKIFNSIRNQYSQMKE